MSPLCQALLYSCLSLSSIKLGEITPHCGRLQKWPQVFPPFFFFMILQYEFASSPIKMGKFSFTHQIWASLVTHFGVSEVY